MSTTLKMSSSYHPKTDGQTKVLNRCLEIYLRCFCSEQPNQWNRLLSWAELCYNTSFQSAIGMTPFEAIYGRPPPTFKQFMPGEIKVPAVEDALRERDEIMRQLKCNLDRAQHRMKTTTDKHRRELHLQVSDMALVKLQPYRQHSVQGRKNHKLSAKYYGPYKVVAIIGKVSYRLELPTTSRVHPVFHVSFLKKVFGQHSAVVEFPTDVGVEEKGYE